MDLEILSRMTLDSVFEYFRFIFVHLILIPLMDWFSTQLRYRYIANHLYPSCYLIYIPGQQYFIQFGCQQMIQV